MTCANAAEIIIKARIAEEHPLLIFNKLPKPTVRDGGLLGVGELLNEGRTLMYSELPDAFGQPRAIGLKISNNLMTLAKSETPLLIWPFRT